MTLCNGMSSESEFTRVPPRCGSAGPAPLPLSVAQRIAAFIDGRTHGEELLHELYDYVLEEPIPQRLRDLLSK
jgi:hypothetical protein